MSGYGYLSEAEYRLLGAIVHGRIFYPDDPDYPLLVSLRRKELAFDSETGEAGDSRVWFASTFGMWALEEARPVEGGGAE